jgi:L-threonylcarbamoyladenylate synthase
VPAHPAMRALLEATDVPLAAPSANASGSISPTRAAHVAQSLAARIPLIIDAGPTTLGLESTIVAVAEGTLRLLRPGPITAEMLLEATGLTPLMTTSEKIEAPGQLASHYAPSLPIRLNAETATPEEWHIGFGPIAGDRSLSPQGDPIVAAANLFDALHEADASGRTAIVIAPIPHDGLGAAINDRLARAAAPR